MVLREYLLDSHRDSWLYGMKGPLFDNMLAAGIKTRAAPDKILRDRLEAGGGLNSR